MQMNVRRAVCPKGHDDALEGDVLLGATPIICHIYCTTCKQHYTRGPDEPYDQAVPATPVTTDRLAWFQHWTAAATAED